ncbi:hypothetical protein FH609_011640 [Streptomyces sp. 3MP-14]|uniref:Uncharacterized protein n=1 Tax=Streptomyces mimosae TaxID=2586635 RepID=A0A5N6AGX0_9ACTN|nr:MULTISPECIES: hypothetical protein [Streptomyces]KAB8167049.1 hypothetical protein FH607_009090 [Streptomyces mimosae]KAB8176990.1 hypothetical protein FH609_011640 [Streptomyces sp. 3MP-14]
MNDKTPPPSPFTALAAAAVQLHEFYAALQGAGFSKAEALELVKAALLRPGDGPGRRQTP